MVESIFKIEYYVPPSHLESVNQALFDAGGGIVGNYDQCAWRTLGRGQFRPDSQSNPYQGTVNQLETVEEYKVELVCKASKLPAVIMALKKAHPYEEPAYSVIKLESF